MSKAGISGAAALGWKTLADSVVTSSASTGAVIAGTYMSLPAITFGASSVIFVGAMAVNELLYGKDKIAIKKYEKLINHSDLEDCLIHHGIEGQKWGVRNGPPYPLNDFDGRPRFKTGEMSPEEYARAKDAWEFTEEFAGISGKEKERIYEELDNNLTYEERGHAIVSRRVDDYLYTAINKGHNQYKIIDRTRVEPPKTWDEQLDDILTEVVGKNWRKYDV